MRRPPPFAMLPIALIGAVLCGGPAPATALEVQIPGLAELVARRDLGQGEHAIATGPWTGSSVPTRAAQGTVEEFIWQVAGDDIRPISLLAALSDQLEAQGFRIDFACNAETCGGFDFRHALSVGQAPDMFIDLSNYHYLAAIREEDGPGSITSAALMVSRGGGTGFIHLAVIRPADASISEPVTPSSRALQPGDGAPEDSVAPIPDPEPAEDLATQLLRVGSIALDDLRFETGASELSGRRYPSLVALAAFLAEVPERQVVLVGHTDTLGSLPANMQLSEARAQAVRRFLILELGVEAEQVEAVGIGFLSPRASNASAEGREANRRVEVVLISP